MFPGDYLTDPYREGYASAERDHEDGAGPAAMLLLLADALRETRTDDPDRRPGPMPRTGKRTTGAAWTTSAVRFAPGRIGPMPRSDERCQRCGGAFFVPILYGMPTGEAADAASRGDLVLGGCAVGPIGSDWHC